jgi:hypothetical protein
MIKNILKSIMLMLIILGIWISNLNFNYKNVTALEAMSGSWEYENGEFTCGGWGEECGVGGGTREDTFEIPPPSTKLIIKPKRKDIIEDTAVELEFDCQKIDFLPESKIPKNPFSFCVTEDGLFLIPDNKAGNVKIFEIKGNSLKLIQIFGLKGYGQGEFGQPALCFYNESDAKFGVMDYGKRTILIFDRIKRKDFEFVQEIPCTRGGRDFHLAGDRLFVSGYIPDKNGAHYDLYYIDLKNKKRTLLLPSHHKYGLKDYKEYILKYTRGFEIRSIGIAGWIDIKGDDVYFVWEGDLKIIKINLQTNDAIWFGQKSRRYFKPSASENLIKAYSQRDSDPLVRERRMMTFVRNVFVGHKYVFVIYEELMQRGKQKIIRMQLYTLAGDFLKDVPIPETPNKMMWFDKKNSILYSLSNKGEKPRGYFVLKYKLKISE